MRALSLVGCLLVLAPTSLAWSPVAYAAEDEPLETVLASVRAEAEAMTALVDTLKAEVRADRLDLTTPAKFSWQRAEAAFDELAARGSLGDWKTALASTRPARSLAREGADEAFSVNASKAVAAAVKDYFDAVEPRVEATRRLVRDMPVDDDGKAMELDRRWWRARAELEEAKTHAAVDAHQRAWRTLETAAGRLDGIVLEVVWGQTEEIFDQQR